MPSENWLRNQVPPVDVIRDLIAIAQALYATRKSEGAGEDELDQIKSVGEGFKLALEMTKAGPNTIGCRASWSHAERGLQALGEALERLGDVGVGKLVSAMGSRFG